MTRIARVVGVIFLSISAGETFIVPASMSQNTGRPPPCRIAWLVETKVIEVVSTSCPSISATSMARCSAAVAELTATACSTPM